MQQVGHPRIGKDLGRAQQPCEKRGGKTGGRPICRREGVNQMSEEGMVGC